VPLLTLMHLIRDLENRQCQFSLFGFYFSISRVFGILTVHSQD
jgi:hypothetical protein